MDKLFLLIVGVVVGTYYLDHIKDIMSSVMNGGDGIG